MGVVFCLAAFVGILFVIVRALLFGDPTSGWPSKVCIQMRCWPNWHVVLACPV